LGGRIKIGDPCGAGSGWTNVWETGCRTGFTGIHLPRQLWFDGSNSWLASGRETLAVGKIKLATKDL